MVASSQQNTPFFKNIYLFPAYLLQCVWTLVIDHPVSTVEVGLRMRALLGRRFGEWGVGKCCLLMRFLNLFAGKMG